MNNQVIYIVRKYNENLSVCKYSNSFMTLSLFIFSSLMSLLIACKYYKCYSCARSFASVDFDHAIITILLQALILTPRVRDTATTLRSLDCGLCFSYRI